MDPHVSIVIPTFNRSSSVRQVLPGYLNQQVNLEVILVDDSTHSKDREDLQKLAREEPRVVLIQSDKRRGMTPSKNIGAERARGQFVFFGEDDCLLSADCLATLCAHQGVTNADIIGGRKIWLGPGETMESALKRANQGKGNPFNTFFMEFRSDLPGERDIPAPFLQTVSLIRKSVFKRIRFDEDYIGFTQGYCWREETDFFMRANEEGFKVIFCPHVVVFNLPPLPGGTHGFSPWSTELWIWRNHRYLLKRHKRFIKKTLGNRVPAPILLGSYILVRIYHRTRNLLWFLKQKWKKIYTTRKIV